MEGDLQGKNFEFSTVIEYFTKRGKPLTPEEVQEMRDEDQAILDERNYQNR